MKYFVNRFFVIYFSFVCLSNIAAKDSTSLLVHYIDVGQGSSVLLQFPCGLMLIDAGGQDQEAKEHLIKYLSDFFQSHSEFQNTIDLLVVTHAHVDHNQSLKEVATKFKIKRYIDDGWEATGDKRMQIWMQEYANENHMEYSNYSFEEITDNGNKHGIHDSKIDPFNCGTVDPVITVFSGRFSKKPSSWSEVEYKNENNHSLVIKVEFGNTSFLFTGDLELKGIGELIKEYSGTSILDVDVLMVGHHGSHNAISEEFLKLVTPKYAIISCGHWNYGLNEGDNKVFNTYKYGHPRVSTLAMLSKYVPRYRPEKIMVQAAEGSKLFRKMFLDKAIYATAWDETIIVKASAYGAYKISTNN